MVKNRNIALCIILSLVTCGIYGWYWFVCLTDDTNTISGEPGTSGVVALVSYPCYMWYLWILLGI